MITKVSTANREEWKALRKKYIGGSDAAAIVGMNPFCSQYALWAEKTGKIPAFEGNLATEVGSYLEEFVAKKFEKETGRKVRRVNQSILNDAYPWAIANIDRDIVGEDAGLEIKTTSELSTHKFKNGEYPGNYYCQCVHYLAMTGKQRWYLAVLIGNREFRIFTIERDENEISALMEAEKAFWWFVQHDTPPAPDGSTSSTNTIRELYPDSSDAVVNLTGFDGELLEYTELCRRIRELEALRDGIANKVKSFMAEAGKGESSRYRISWSTSERSTFDVKRFRADYPNLNLNEYYKTSKARTFRVSERKEK